MGIYRFLTHMRRTVIILNIVVALGALARFWFIYMSALGSAMASHQSPWEHKWFLVRGLIMVAVASILLSHIDKIRTLFRALYFPLIGIVAVCAISYAIQEVRASKFYLSRVELYTKNNAMKDNKRYQNLPRDYEGMETWDEARRSFIEIEHFITHDALYPNILISVGLFEDREPTVTILGKTRGAVLESYRWNSWSLSWGFGITNCRDAQGKTIFDNFTIVDKSEPDSRTKEENDDYLMLEKKYNFR